MQPSLTYSVQPGEMLGESPYMIADTSYCYIAVFVGEQNESSRYNEYSARIYDGIATGGTIRLFNPSDTIGIQNFIRTSRDDNDKNTLVNSIKGIYAIPKIFPFPRRERPISYRPAAYLDGSSDCAVYLKPRDTLEKFIPVWDCRAGRVCDI